MLAWPGEAHGGGANRAAGLAAKEAAGAETVPGAGTAACATGAAGKAVAAVTALAAMLIVLPADIVQGETATGTECGSKLALPQGLQLWRIEGHDGSAARVAAQQVSIAAMKQRSD